MKSPIKLRLIFLFLYVFFVSKGKLYRFQVCILHLKVKIIILSVQAPEVIKLFSCSTEMSMKFILLINLKFTNNENSFLLNIAEHENFSGNMKMLTFLALSYLSAEKISYCW